MTQLSHLAGLVLFKEKTHRQSFIFFGDCLASSYELRHSRGVHLYCLCFSTKKTERSVSVLVN